MSDAKWIKSRKHMWKKNKNGDIDEMAWDYDYHNGPSCTLCYRSPCMFCNPDWEKLEDCDEEHFECSACGEMIVDQKPCCPHCGAKMDGEPDD